MRSAEIRLLRIHRTSVDFIWRHYQTASDLDCTLLIFIPPALVMMSHKNVTNLPYVLWTCLFCVHLRTARVRMSLYSHSKSIVFTSKWLLGLLVAVSKEHSLWTFPALSFLKDSSCYKTYWHHYQSVDEMKHYRMCIQDNKHMCPVTSNGKCIVTPDSTFV